MKGAWLDRTQYPFDAHFFVLPEGRMHYVDEGDGPPVVMVHGNPTWSFLYRSLIHHLRARHRCVAPDHLGFGLSDKPASWSYHPREHAANMAVLIDSLGLNGMTLVVHDWGGPIGLSYALDHPQRIERLVIMNTWMWSVRSDPYYVAYRVLVGGPIGRLLTRKYNFFARVVPKKVYGDRSRFTDEIHRHYMAPLASPADRKGCAEFPRQITAASDWLESLWRRRAALQDVPKMIVWGMKDIGFRRKELERWRAAFPDAQVIELDDVGHYVQEEAPDRLARAVDRFLGEGAAG